jgi:hypothetical protein
MIRLARAAALAAALTVPLAGLAAVAAPAGATARPSATTVCGPTCQDIWGKLLGPSMILNATNQGAFAPGAFRGRKLNLRPGSNAATNEDFTVRQVGQLRQFCTASGGNGQIAASSYACLTLLPLTPAAPVFQIQFTPNSVQTNYCAGAVAATAGFKVRLQRCGQRRVYWIEDGPDGTEPARVAPASLGDFVPLIFAADTRGSNPLVATAHEFGTSPAHPVTIERLNLTSAGVAVAAQLVRRPAQNGPFPGP